MSFAPMKAIAVGSSSPEANVLTSSRGSTMDGPCSWAAAVVVIPQTISVQRAAIVAARVRDGVETIPNPPFRRDVVRATRATAPGPCDRRRWGYEAAPRPVCSGCPVLAAAEHRLALLGERGQA